MVCTAWGRRARVEDGVGRVEHGEMARGGGAEHGAMVRSYQLAFAIDESERSNGGGEISVAQTRAMSAGGRRTCACTRTALGELDMLVYLSW